MIVGLAGDRHVGKSTIAGMILSDNPDQWVVAHAFAPGKAMVRAYYQHLGVDSACAEQMINGIHKDTPFSELVVDRWYGVADYKPVLASDILPGYNSREFMEKFGKWLGTGIGYAAEYTLVPELTKLRHDHPNKHILIESLVYEVEAFRKADGFLVYVERPDNPHNINASETGKINLRDQADLILVNDGDIQALQNKVDDMILSKVMYQL